LSTLVLREMLGFSHSSMLQFGRGANSQVVTPGITKPLHEHKLTKPNLALNQHFHFRFWKI